MIPGEPLLHVQRPMRLPGGPTPNPAHRTAARLLCLVAATLIGWATISWLTRDEMPGCIDVPEGSDYHGWDNSWWFNGNLIGHSAHEDAPCILPA